MWQPLEALEVHAFKECELRNNQSVVDWEAKKSMKRSMVQTIR